MNRYTWLGLCKELCNVPENILLLLQEDFKSFTKNNGPYMTSDGYMQWHVHSKQNHMIDLDHKRPWALKKDATWNQLDSINSKPILNYFSTYVAGISRLCYSVMSPYAIVEKHPGHQLPRIQIPLNDVDIDFGFVDDIGEHVYKFEYGKAYVVNVCYEHFVVSKSNKARHACYFCFEDFITSDMRSLYSINGV